MIKISLKYAIKNYMALNISIFQQIYAKYIRNKDVNINLK